MRRCADDEMSTPRRLDAALVHHHHARHRAARLGVRSTSALDGLSAPSRRQCTCPQLQPSILRVHHRPDALSSRRSPTPSTTLGTPLLARRVGALAAWPASATCHIPSAHATRHRRRRQPRSRESHRHRRQSPSSYGRRRPAAPRHLDHAPSGATAPWVRSPAEPSARADAHRPHRHLAAQPPRRRRAFRVRVRSTSVDLPGCCPCAATRNQRAHPPAATAASRSAPLPTTAATARRRRRQCGRARRARGAGAGRPARPGAALPLPLLTHRIQQDLLLC